MRSVLILALFASLLAGCAAAPTPGPDKVTPPVPPPAGAPIPADAAAQIAQARQDLAQRLGVAVESVTVATVIGQDFTSEAFYCSKTTGRIARDDNPAAILGQTILLNVSGRRYEYHASDQAVVFCRPLP